MAEYYVTMSQLIIICKNHALEKLKTGLSSKALLL